MRNHHSIRSKKRDGPPPSGPPANPNQPCIPEHIGRFHVLEEIGKGGCGVVYKVTDPNNGNTVAVKQLRPDRLTETNKNNFLEEARRMATFDHVNILKILEVDECAAPPHYVMPFMAGDSKNYVNSTGGGVETVLGIAYNIAGALQYIHSKGWIHRDVKPSNILMGLTGEPFLTDFGIALQLSSIRDENTDETAGTLMYMAPEQLLTPCIADGRADIYALGVVMYELLTNTLPYKGRGTETMISRTLFYEPPQPRTLKPDIPVSVETIVMKAMAKSANLRYQTVDELLHDIKANIVRCAIQRRLRAGR